MASILQNTTDHKQSKILKAFDGLGLPGLKPVITTVNRELVKGLLNGLGFPTETYLNASLRELEDAYWSLAYNGIGLIPFITFHENLSLADIKENITACLDRASFVNPQATSSLKSDNMDWQISDYLATNPYIARTLPLPVPANTPPTIGTHGTATDASKQAADAIAALISSIQGKPTELDETKVIALIKQHSLSTSITINNAGNTAVIPTGLHHKILPKVIRYLSAGVNIYLVGAAGSGKTTIAEQAAHALGLPFYFNGALDSEYKLTGFIDAKGAIVSTAFRKAYENGGVYLFDEVDASLPSALLAFNAALANGHTDFPDCSVKKHENFHCIAAANTYGKGADRQYVGRNQLDAATLDRFAFIECDYDEKLERALTANSEWCDYVQSIRKAVFALKIRHVVSPRASILGAALLAAGETKEEAAASVIWKGLDKDTIQKIENAA